MAKQLYTKNSPWFDVYSSPVGRKYWQLSDGKIFCGSYEATAIMDYDIAFDLFNAI